MFTEMLTPHDGIVVALPFGHDDEFTRHRRFVSAADDAEDSRHVSDEGYTAKLAPLHGEGLAKRRN